MNTIEAIMTRKSTRSYSEKPIPKEAVDIILKAGMSGPSAVNKRPWQFIVVDDKEVLAEMARVRSNSPVPFFGAPLVIMVCGDLDKAFEPIPDFWDIDSTIACQNMILAAQDLGIGSVWLGTWPGARSDAEKKFFDLPDPIIPHSIIAFGYPADGEVKREKPAPFEPEKVHYNKW